MENPHQSSNKTAQQDQPSLFVGLEEDFQDSKLDDKDVISNDWEGYTLKVSALTSYVKITIQNMDNFV